MIDPDKAQDLEYAASLGLSPYVLNFDKIKAQPHLPGFVAQLVQKIEDQGALHVGDWLEHLPHLDFFSLKFAMESLNKDKGILPEKEERRHIAAIAVIILEILVVGEGLEVTNDIDIKIERKELMWHFIEIEAAKRAGEPIEVFYKNMTLDCDMKIDGKSPIIAKLIGE